MIELLKLEFDKDILTEINKEIKRLEKEIANIKILQLFNGKYDKLNAICTLHAGAGRN